jgi:excisionase family DNA binding protein
VNEKLYTVVEAAEMLHVAERTIAQWLNSRELKGWKAGRRWLIPESSIDSYLRRAQPPGVEPPDIGALRQAAVGVSQTRHVSGLLRNVKELRSSLDYLETSHGLDRWTRGPDLKLRLPGFNRVTWRSVEQHLVGTSA